MKLYGYKAFINGSSNFDIRNHTTGHCPKLIFYDVIVPVKFYWKIAIDLKIAASMLV